jgi:hypothetical protein
MSPFIYVTDDREGKPPENQVKSRVKGVMTSKCRRKSYRLPAIFSKQYSYNIYSQKVKTHLGRFVPKQYLKKY